MVNNKKNILTLAKELESIKNSGNVVGIMNANENNVINIPIERNTHVNKENLMKPIGILDPEGLQLNPLSGEPYQDIYFDPNQPVGEHNPTYKFLSSQWSNFPMYDKKEEAINAFYNNQVVLIISGTGSGKTVLAPKFLLHTLNYQGRIGITNPKRIPTNENALYAAKTLDVPIGKQVGMKYRDSDPKFFSAKDSKLIYCTDGYVLARLQNDPMLPEFDAIVIDEAHERGIQIDLLLLLLKRLIKLRPEFKLVIMSATVNEKIFVDYFPVNQFKFAVVDAGGKPNFPIEQHFLKKNINKFDENGNILNKDAYIEAAADRAVEILKSTPEGDILVFFPGKGECQDGCLALHKKLEVVNKNANKKLYCQVLHGATDKDLKELIVNNKKYKELENGRYNRKVIFATEVAESSITFKGLDFVIDAGLSNQNKFYSERNLYALEQKYISKAAHKQRMGRVGRKRPGTCYNLFTEEEYNKFIDYRVAPILQDDISKELLYFLSGKSFVSKIDFPFKYPPKNNKKNKSGGENIQNKTPQEIKKNNNIEQQGEPLANFLNEMIERPQEDKVKRTLYRLIALGAIDINGSVGTISDMGRAMAAFDTMPEIGRMLIAGYNYHCRDDIVNLAAIMEKAEYRMDGIFEKFSSYSKDPAEKEREKEKYQKIKKKWSSSLGDHFSLIAIYNAFSERRYDTTDRRTNRIIKEKQDPEKVRAWCKENYLNYKRLDSVKKVAKDLNRKFTKVIKIYREKHPVNKPTHLFIPNVPVISDKQDENIIRALVEGLYLNLLKKTGDRKYTNCFPEQRTTTGLTMDSLFAIVKSPTKYALYSELKSIFGKVSYSIVSKVSPTIIEQLLNSKEGKFVEACFKKMEEEKVDKKQQQHHKKKHYKKEKKRRF